MKVAEVAIEKIIPYARNPRKNANAIDTVAASLKEFGFRQPIVVDEEMVIIVGHTRYHAAEKLGIKKVPVHIARDLTAAQIKAYRIADNKTGEASTWDYELLAIEMEDIGDMFTGFDKEEIGKLFGGDESEEETGTGEPEEETIVCPHCDRQFDSKKAKKIK